MTTKKGGHEAAVDGACEEGSKIVRVRLIISIPVTACRCATITYESNSDGLTRRVDFI